MLCLGVLLVSLTGALTSPMHMKPPINRAVCDDPSFLIDEETAWCYRPGSQVREGGKEVGFNLSLPHVAGTL